MLKISDQTKLARWMIFLCCIFSNVNSIICMLKK